MSTIRAKQEICLNISSVRSLANYSAGRYCLRFSLQEIYESDYGKTGQNKYAVPVSVLEYKPMLSSPHPYSNPLFQLSEVHYQTKPFLLKPHSEIPISQICIFKHDINIFNSKYETDFHELTLKCTCELLSFDYSGDSAKVVGTFDGRIKGVGIGDALLIDFGEGVSCQVLGSVHSCVYQFQYVYTGDPAKKRDVGLMKDSISVDNSQVLVVNSNKGYQNVEGPMETMNFEKYCELQSKEYVESLLEYLLGEVKRSDEKTSLSLQLLEQISKPNSPEIHLQLSPVHQPLPSEQSQLERSLKSQSQLEVESIIDESMKERLSIIKAESKYYRSDQAEDEGSEELVIDEDQFLSQGEKGTKKEEEEEEELIILDSDQENIQMAEVSKGRYKDISYSRSNYEYRPLEINLEPVQDKLKQEDKTKRRKKIFVHSNPSNSAPSFQEMVQRQKDKSQKIERELSQLQLENRASVYEARFIPSNPVQNHPNRHHQQKEKEKEKKSTSKVTIQEFEKLLHSNCLEIYEKWRKFVNYLAQPQGTMLVNAYRLEYRKKLDSLLGESVIRFKGSLDIDIYSKEEAQRNKMAYQIRSQVAENQKNVMINEFRFYNKELFSNKKPIMFEQKFEKISNYVPEPDLKPAHKKSFLKVSLSSNPQYSEIQHAIFLVHGLGACRLDMDKIKVEIKRNFKQKVHIVTSCSNEGRTEGNITTMGVRFAHEVEQEMVKNFGNLETLENKGVKISFIGHSMGGIIIRSALPRLEKFKSQFHSFVTLSSPHLGYCYSNSKLIDVGLWLINNWQKCESILQLTMQDTPANSNPKAKFNSEDTFLYKLSLEKGLEWFKKLTFLASRQDLYVPYFSARVQKHEQCISDLKTNYQYAITHSKMVDNILSRVTGTVTRIDVNFCITEQNIDNLIGRAAHINFVNNVEFLRLLTITDENTLL